MTKTDAVREALDSLVLTISRLRPKMKLPTQAEWDDLEEAHNRAARALSPAASPDATPAATVGLTLEEADARMKALLVQFLRIAETDEWADGGAVLSALDDARDLLDELEVEWRAKGDPDDLHCEKCGEEFTRKGQAEHVCKATPAAKPDAPGGEYCDVVAGCVWPKGHGGIGHCLTVGGTPPPSPPETAREIVPDDETVQAWLENGVHEEIEREVVRARRELAARDAELAKVRQEFRVRGSVIDTLNAEIATLRADMEAERRAEELDAELAEVREFAEHMRQEKSKLHAEAIATATQNAELSEQVASLRARLEGMAVGETHNADVIEHLRARLEEAERWRQTNFVRAEEEKSRADAAEARAKEAERKLDALTDWRCIDEDAATIGECRANTSDLEEMCVACAAHELSERLGDGMVAFEEKAEALLNAERRIGEAVEWLKQNEHATGAVARATITAVLAVLAPSGVSGSTNKPKQKE